MCYRGVERLLCMSVSCAVCPELPPLQVFSRWPIFSLWDFIKKFFFFCLLGMFWFWKLWWRREHSLPPVGVRGCPDWPFHCCHTVLVSREWQVDSTTQYLPILSVQRGFLSCFLLKWHKVLDAIWKSGSGVTCLKTVRNDVNFNSIYKYNEDTVYICFSPPLIFWG